jgi:hypothetical protein
VIKNKNEDTMNSPTIQLPSGATIQMCDFVRDSLRSAFVVTPYGTEDRWEVFSGSRSQALEGDKSRYMTRAHTNIPRSGDSGLPKDWEMLVDNWKAICPNMSQVVIDWASETSACLEYNGKSYGDRTLLELLLDHPVLGTHPVHIRENLSYGVRIDSGKPTALKALRNSLRGDPQNKAIVDELDILAQLGDQGPGPVTNVIVHGIRKVQQKLQPTQSLTCWISLEGLIKRCVV